MTESQDLNNTPDNSSIDTHPDLVAFASESGSVRDEIELEVGRNLIQMSTVLLELGSEHLRARTMLAQRIQRANPDQVEPPNTFALIRDAEHDVFLRALEEAGTEFTEAYITLGWDLDQLKAYQDTDPWQEPTQKNKSPFVIDEEGSIIHSDAKATIDYNPRDVSIDGIECVRSDAATKEVTRRMATPGEITALKNLVDVLYPRLTELYVALEGGN